MNRLLPILLILISSAVLAESGAYRVEVIVLRNLNVESESTVLQELRSFSQYPDSAETEQIEDPASVLPTNSPEALTPLVGGAPRGDYVQDERYIAIEHMDKVRPGNGREGALGYVRRDLPDDLEILPKKSDYMNDVWRRLRSSQAYRPLVYAAWEQNRTDYYPPMRIHDENIIDSQLRPPTHIMVADLAELDPLAAYRSTFYQLDGSVQLRRSRFLHLYLDLEYRENPLATDPVLPVVDENHVQPGMDKLVDDKPTRKTFTLKQNRQVRTGQVQYFDTPFFGALVFVSAISAN